MPKRRTFNNSNRIRLLFECIPNHKIGDFQVDEYTRVYGILRVANNPNLKICHH